MTSAAKITAMVSFDVYINGERVGEVLASSYVEAKRKARAQWSHRCDII